MTVNTEARERWTPGPWKRGLSFDELRDDCVFSEFEIICEFVRKPANAHLIAAAPSLYEAGKRVSELAEQIWVKLSDDEARLLTDAYAALDAALAQARGES